MARKYISRLGIIFCVISSFLVFMRCESQSDIQSTFNPVEATISDIHSAIRNGDLTCCQLVEIYLNRVEVYDQPTKLNAIVLINPNAINRAKELDEEFRQTGKLRPLHGIPIIVKDNYDTHDLPTTAGSLAMKGSIPPDDAYQVRKLREAGAIVLAKSNMAEWAFSPYQTVSSIAGTTRNPYDLSRVPAGSSGGTAAAVAANFGTVGLGTDTGNSIRGPSSHNCLVGIRSTMGLTSRDGIVPLYLRNDIGGPMARTVEDAVRILEIIAGYDPADPVTKMCSGKMPDNYSQFLKKDGLNGIRIGIFRTYTNQETTDPQIKSLFEQSIIDLRNLGAEIVDPFAIPDFDSLTKDIWCDVFQRDINAYLASLGERAPVKSLAEIVKSGLYAPYIEEDLKYFLKIDKLSCQDLYHEPKNIKYRDVVLKAMREHNLDAFIYPTWSNPPRKIGDLESPAGDNSQLIPPHTGQPGFTVPMGFTTNQLPAGLQIVGKMFGEPELIRIAWNYEQATKHRRPPDLFPELR